MESKKGLWSNIRNKAAQNKITGTTSKAPTKQMLEQEKKIKKMAFGGLVKSDKNPEGGLSESGRERYNRETGSNLKAPVDKGDNPRRVSFAARFSGMKGAMEKDGKPTRKALALKKWGFSSVEEAKSFVRNNKKQQGGMNQEQQLMQMFEQFAMSIEDDNFQSAEDVYKEFVKLNPQQQQQFVQSIQQQAPQQNPQQEQVEQEMMQTGGTNAVRKYQQMLNDKYNANIKVDGIWGKNTQAAYVNSKSPTFNQAKPIRNTEKFNPFNVPSEFNKKEYDAYIQQRSDIISRPPDNYQAGGIPTSYNGYYELDPEENPIARIPSNSITMRGLDFPIRAVGGTTGMDYGYMQPDEDYEFDDEEYIYEIPKAQVGSRSPRQVETEEEKKARLKKYAKKEVIKTRLDKDYYSDTEPYRNTEGAFNNKDYFLMGKEKSYTNTRGIKDIKNKDYFTTEDYLKGNPIPSEVAPFINGYVPKNSEPVAISKSTTRKNGKTKRIINKPNTNKPSTTTTPTAIATNKRFNTKFTDVELDAQADEFGKTLTTKPINVRELPSSSNGIVAAGRTNTDDGFIRSKPVTINYDNDAEARAIQYRKLENSSLLAPYRGTMTMQSPELYQESATPYLDNIREQRNTMLQQLNPNTSTGQAVMASMYGQQLNQENQAIGQVARNNAQSTTQFLNQRADARNKQQQFDYQNDNRYYGDIAQLQASQSEEDNIYMNSIANMEGKRLQAKNALLNTAIMTGLPSDALDIGEEGVTFDVGKIPKGFYDGKYNRTPSVASTEKQKTMMYKGSPHAIEYDENGIISNLREIPVAKAQYGGMTKYNFRKQKSQ